MSITLIAAVALNGVIGNQNTIPWHVPADFKHFSATTRGHAVVMGSKTFWSLPEAYRPLPKRTNIVLSRDTLKVYGTRMDDVIWAQDIASALREAREIHGQDEIFIIGGASVYEQAMPLADRMLISLIPMEPEGDTFFPTIDSGWSLTNDTPMEGFNLLEYHKN